jgi:hypothetical protein
VNEDDADDALHRTIRVRCKAVDVEKVRALLIEVLDGIDAEVLK